jgi:chromosome segregation ATPase
MARLGPPLAVLAFVLCVTFCAFAAALNVGGTNWRLKADELREYSITTIGGGEAPIRYELTDRVTTETLGTHDSYPAAVVAAYKARSAKLQERRGEIQARVDAMNAEVPTRIRLNDADRIAMDGRIRFQQSEYERLSNEIEVATRDGADLTRRAEAIRSEAATRTEDAERLEAELAAVRADLFRVQEQIAALEDRRVRLEGALARAERRRDQLADRIE